MSKPSDRAGRYNVGVMVVGEGFLGSTGFVLGSTWVPQRLQRTLENLAEPWRKQWFLVGIMAGALMAAPAFAQHKAPNQQPATDAAPTAPTGELVLGTVTLTKATTADGQPRDAGR